MVRVALAAGVLVFAAVSSVGPVVRTLRTDRGARLGDVVMQVAAVAMAGGVTARLAREG